MAWLNEENVKNNVILNYNDPHTSTHTQFHDVSMWFYDALTWNMVNKLCLAIHQFTCWLLASLFLLLRKTKSLSTDGVCYWSCTWIPSDMWWCYVKLWCVNSQLYMLWMKPLHACGLACEWVTVATNFDLFSFATKYLISLSPLMHMLNLNISTFQLC